MAGSTGSITGGIIGITGSGEIIGTTGSNTGGTAGGGFGGCGLFGSGGKSPS